MCEISENLNKDILSEFRDGKGYRVYKELGAHPGKINGKLGTRFAVWVPGATEVYVVGDFNDWNVSADSMEPVPGTDVWKKVVRGCGEGSRYLFRIITAKGEIRTKIDPFGFLFKNADPEGPCDKKSEENTGIDKEARENASIICNFSGEFTWSDDDWLTKRKHADNDPLKERMSIYELHLGSWQRGTAGKYLNYKQIAEKLVKYVEEMGFTHVEFLPVAEHPYYPSWGYQVSGFFAPTSRYGTPDDFRHLVNELHGKDIGVIIDWVPGHFAKDGWGLECFNGEPVFEHPDEERNEHPEWGTLEFNFGKKEVRSFLVANALYWCEEFHVDGLRVDAVASMLYLDYARKPGEWKPNEYKDKSFRGRILKGNENLAAVDFFQELNRVVSSKDFGVVTIAEESTDWSGVTREGARENLALGFTLKWDMGWMNNSLEYFQREPKEQEPKEQEPKKQWLKERQQWHDEKLTFTMHYFKNENYLRPLSHDEVVHEKRSLLKKMPGDECARFANLRVLLGYQWCLPGKQLLFMGGEVGQHSEWDHGGEIDLELDHGGNIEWKFRNVAGLPGGLQRWVKALNDLYREGPALWEADYDGYGFEWIEREYSEAKVISFVRRSVNEEQVLAVFNLSTKKHLNYRIGLPGGGWWCEVLNSDAEVYGGRNCSNSDGVHADGIRWQDQDFSGLVELPPSTCLIFKRG